MPAFLPAAVALLLAGCNLPDTVSSDYLRADGTTLAVPADLGLQAIAAEIPVGSATIRGFLIPAAPAGAGTVVLLHGAGSNAGELHPYYAFLHRHGLQVFVFDQRGFGLSDGEASLQGMVNDMPAVLAWLRQRPEVDGDKLALYGFGVGATLALRCAVRQTGIAAVVLEDLVSVHEEFYAAAEQQHGSLSAKVSTGMAAFSGLPDELEPGANAEQLRVPALFVGSAGASPTSRRTLLNGYLKAKGPKQLWLLPETPPAPAPLLVWHGQYQAEVAGFLRAALAGAPALLETDWRDGGKDKDGAVTKVTLQRRGPSDAAPWAVEVCGVDLDGAPSWRRVWLDGGTGEVSLHFPKPAGAVGAVRWFDAVGTDDGSWQPAPEPLQQAVATFRAVAADVELLRHGQPDAAAVAGIAARLAAARAAQPFDPRLDAELADAYYQLGRRLLGQDDAAARHWLQLAVDSAPAQPQLHVWPLPEPSFGYPQQAAVDAARQLLQHGAGG